MNPDIRVFSSVNVHRKDGGKPGFENAQPKIRQSDAKFSLCFPKFLSDRKGVPPAAQGGAESLGAPRKQAPRVPVRAGWWSWTLIHGGCLDYWEHWWKLGISAGSGITHMGDPTVYLTNVSFMCVLWHLCT